jgi:hypothetical protein
MSKIKIIVCACIIAWANIADSVAQKVQVLVNTQTESQLQVSLPQVKFIEQLVDGKIFTKISARQATSYANKSEPEVLHYTIPLSIARNNDAHYTISDAVFTDYQNINLISSKGHFLRTDKPSEVPHTFNNEIYSNNEWYPLEKFATI